MMHTRLRKIVRELTIRKTRTMLVSLSIFIGVVGVITLFSMGQILTNKLEGAIDQDRLAMVRAYVTPSSADPIDHEAILESLRELDEIGPVEGMAIFPLFWKHPGGDELERGRVFGYSEPFDKIGLEPIELVKGRYPVAGQREIALERRFADTHGFELGDSIVLRIVASDDARLEETWKVVGVIFQPYQYPTLPGTPTQLPADSMLFATFEDTRRITGVDGFRLINARFSSVAVAEQRIPAFEAALAETPYVTYVTLLEDPSENPAIQRMRTFSDVLALVALVALVVSGFIVFNVVNAMVIEQRRHIGVMKALGATAWDNFFMYAGLSLAYGVIGTVPGVLIGVPTGYYGATALAPQFNIFVDAFTVSPIAVLFGVMMGLLVPIAAAILPVLLGIRVTILEAITDFGIHATYHMGPAARVLSVLPLPINGKQALRNVLQKKGRLLLTIMTLSSAAGAFMGIFAAFSTFNKIVDDTFDTFGYQLSINPNSAQDFAQIRYLLESEFEDEIEAIEPATVLSIDVEGYTPQNIGGTPAFLVAFGLNPDNQDMVNFDLTSGTTWQHSDDPDAVQKQAGDSIRIRTGGSDYQSFQIIGTSTYAFDAVWFSWQTVSRLGGLYAGMPQPNDYLTIIALNGVEVGAIGVKEQARLILDFSAGAFPAAGEIAISEPLAEQWSLAVGDVVSLQSGDNSADSRIGGIFPIPSQFGDPDQPVVLVDWEQLVALEGLLLDETRPAPNSVSVILAEADPDREAVADWVDDINDLLLANGINASFVNWIESAEIITQLISTGSTVLNIAAACIGAVGAIGLLSTLSMSVFERQKEIGVMRSIGATSSKIVLLFLVEGLIVGFVAWLIGIPLSYWLNDVLINAFNFQDVAGLEYPPSALLYGLGGTLVIATVASLWPSIAAARKTVSDILRYR